MKELKAIYGREDDRSLITPGSNFEAYVLICDMLCWHLRQVVHWRLGDWAGWVRMTEWEVMKFQKVPLDLADCLYSGRRLRNLARCLLILSGVMDPIRINSVLWFEVFLLANTLLRSVRPSQGPKEKGKGKLRSSSATLLPLSIRSPLSAWQLSPLTYFLKYTGRSLVAEFEGKKEEVWRPSHPRVHHDTIQSVVKK